MNKQILISIILILLALPLVSAQLAYQPNKDLDLKVPCVSSGNQCTAFANCTLTIQTPNGTNIVNNGLMTNAGNYHNYTINNASLSTLGYYQATVYCNDVGNKHGYVTFEILISPTGSETTLKDALVPGLLLIIMIVLIAFSVLMHNKMFKSLFVIVALLIALIVLNYANLLLSNYYLQESVNSIYKIVFWIIIIAIIFFGISLVMELIAAMQQKKHDKMDGIELNNGQH